MMIQVLAAVTLTLTSTNFTSGGTLPKSAEYNQYGCTGNNTPPKLVWSGAPAATKSFALTMHDPDAKAPGGWWHWVVFNIPGSRASLDTSAESTVISWVEGTTSFKTRGYGGPCPPPGTPHHYDFTLYALDVTTIPGANGDTTGPDLVAAMQGHVVAKATLTGMYGR